MKGLVARVEALEKELEAEREKVRLVLQDNEGGANMVLFLEEVIADMEGELEKADRERGCYSELGIKTRAEARIEAYNERVKRFFGV